MAEKEELLEELYGLRAGLSVYSEEADALQQIEDESWAEELEQLNIASDVRGIAIDGSYYRLLPMEEVEHLGYKMFDYDPNRENPGLVRLIQNSRLDKKIFDRDSGYWDENRSEEMEKKCDEQCRIAEKIYEKWFLSDEMEPTYLRLRKEFSESELKEGEEWFAKHSAQHVRVIFKTIFTALLTLGMAIVYLLFGIQREDFWKYVMLGGLALFGLLFIISAVKYIYFRLHPIYYVEKSRRKQLKRDIAHPEKSDKMLASYAARERLRALVKKREDKTYPIVLRTEELYKALQKQYAPVLDERNWKNLDLVIFALETGRAENLKEALQYTDGEMRTRRIERAIQQATSQICSTIRSGFASLETTIHNCCNQLSAQIQTIGGQILATNQQILNTQREMLSEQRFSNALLAKADVTSMQLMNDVHKIRGNSDYLNMRLRNG